MYTTPTFTIKDEIATLQRLIRQTRHAIRKKTIDPIKGGRLISQTSIALSRLILTQHQITPDPKSQLQQETAELKAEIERIFGVLGWNKHP
jgi:hypothetical protein